MARIRSRHQSTICIYCEKNERRDETAYIYIYIYTAHTLAHIKNNRDEIAYIYIRRISRRISGLQAMFFDISKKYVGKATPERCRRAAVGA